MLGMTHSLKDSRLELGVLLTPELLQMLHSLYPPPTVRPDRTTDELMYEGGKRAVVEYLQNCYDYLQREATHARLAQGKRQVSVQVAP